MLKQREIVLVPIPFTDLASVKRRPVVVISNDAFNRKSDDIVVVAMTSNLEASDFGILVTTNDLEKGALNRPSKIRCDKIYTLAQSIGVKTFGQVKPATLDKIREQIELLTSADRG